MISGSKALEASMLSNPTHCLDKMNMLSAWPVGEYCESSENACNAEQFSKVAILLGIVLIISTISWYMYKLWSILALADLRIPR